MVSQIYSADNLTDTDYNKLAKILKNGGIGILPTDTIYGISTSAFQQNSIEKIYTLRKRNKWKPMIILIHQIDDLSLFKVLLDTETKKIVMSLWPGKTSLIFPISNPQLNYLHRGTGTLAFRIPNYPLIHRILKTSGPLVSPSANFEGEHFAKNIKEAEQYFTDSVEFYLDDGEKNSNPSTVAQFEGHKLRIIRQGETIISPSLVV